MPVFPSPLMLSVDLVRTLCKLVFSLLWLENVDPVRQFRWIKSVGRRSPYTHTRLERSVRVLTFVNRPFLGMPRASRMPGRSFRTPDRLKTVAHSANNSINSITVAFISLSRYDSIACLLAYPPLKPTATRLKAEHQQQSTTDQMLAGNPYAAH